ncbi:hypothetical protein F751_4988 [Auxenochlorella protothecoides]|uniref:Uncharacterized protein n=1 Tax=Auxenochlorella protothecoides TaxID=3075 RepID=A0A087SMH3_AUXPR|nr:hypothetical protein F751_4988 [Auxenochlorella protothecoides]KFM26927.1 hypothetical protein F751_4988 [Auxenochlorella protothecoides]
MKAGERSSRLPGLGGVRPAVLHSPRDCSEWNKLLCCGRICHMTETGSNALSMGSDAVATCGGLSFMAP